MGGTQLSRRRGYDKRMISFQTRWLPGPTCIRNVTEMSWLFTMCRVYKKGYVVRAERKGGKIEGEDEDVLVLSGPV